MGMSGETGAAGGAGVFPNTHWSVVLAATQGRAAEAEAALEVLCRAYWYPLYAYARRCGQPHADAQDLTQEFFGRLLERRWLDAADREKGKLRSFLIVSFKHFMSEQWRRTQAQRRGGGQSQERFDTSFAEGRYAADPTALAPDETYDRQWALRLLDLALARLRGEFEAAGKTGDFDALKDCLMAARGGIDYATLSRQLGVAEGTVRVAAHRLRKRFREIYREEVALTLADDGDIEAELRHLAAALALKEM